jgi:MFS family permease
MPGPERLFTARFALMFGFSFAVFLSAFQLFPTAPFHILALGGTSTEAGLFLGLLTYASAVSAPLMGGVADRIGKRRILFVCSAAIAVFSGLYAVAPSYQLMLGLVIVQRG